jgi:hypothetical protein
MTFDARDQSIRKRFRIAGNAECARRSYGDRRDPRLPQLLRTQRAHA